MKACKAISGKLLLATLMAASAAQAQVADPVPYPEAPELTQKLDVEYFRRDQVWDYKALDKYNEPAFVTEQVKKGLLPAVKDRLPEEPQVFQTQAMPDGPGEYGGVLRMVIGARPTGWNWLASNTQGYGGVNKIIQECLTKTNAMFQITPEEREPMPNLAKSWKWSEDGKQLTMQLIKGAKWSDGDNFDADDVMFTWVDNILDPNVPAPAAANTFGEGTTLKKIDDYTVQWTFTQEFPVLNLFAMSNQFCPGPSHLLKPQHPKYNADNSYRDYINAFGPATTPWVTMGAWTTVEYKPDEMMIMRRNPYYWKVDEQGNQLPYKNELHVKLSEWKDRMVQTLAGNADMANLDEPTMLLEGLNKARGEKSPAKFIFGPRTQGWALELNFSEVNGVVTEQDKAIRKLNRDIRFRRALTQAIDRKALGQSLVRGPFTTIYPGGLMPESPYFDPESVVYYPYSLESTKELLSQIGLKDTNGDGYVDWTEGKLAGQTVELTLTYATGSASEVQLAENLLTMLNEAGLKANASPLPNNSRDSVRFSGIYDFMVVYTDDAYIIPEKGLPYLAPVSSSMPYWHVGGDNLLDFEKELVTIVNEFRTASTAGQRETLMKRYNETFTRNIYNIGLTSATGVVLVNKRMKNVHPALPMKGYDWSEEAIMRERLWTPASDQVNEIFPNTLPQS